MGQLLGVGPLLLPCVLLGVNSDNLTCGRHLHLTSFYFELDLFFHVLRKSVDL